MKAHVGLALAVVALSMSSCSWEQTLELLDEEGGVQPPVQTRIPTATVDDLAIPTNPSAESPFADPTFSRGIEAWRRLHTQGACASCHTPDATDLAYFNYTDAEILRRAMGQEASEEDAWAIVDLVRFQRQRLGFDRPLDPTKVRFLQPGGDLIDGPTTAHKDFNLATQLRDRGLRLFQPEKITTVEEAHQVVDELLALDLRTVQIGIPFNRWSDDSFRGEEHRTFQKWIPEAPRVPLDGAVKDWYELQNRYIEEPTPENLWAYLDSDVGRECKRGYCDTTEPLTDNLGILSPDVNGSLVAVMAGKYRSVQIAGHMMRVNDSKFPYVHDLDPTIIHDPRVLGDSYNGKKLERLHLRSDFRNIVHSRIDSIWRVGASERTTRNKFRDTAPEFMLIKTNDHRWDSKVNQIVWMWSGALFDPALQFSAAGNKTEYFWEGTNDYQGIAGGFEDLEGRSVTRSQDLAVHRFLMRSYFWAHEQFGYDTRYETNHVNGDPVSGRYFCGRGTPDFKGLPDAYGGDFGQPDGYQDLVNDLRANLIRTMTLLVYDSYLKHGKSRAAGSCITEQINVWADLATYEGQNYESIQPIVEELVIELSDPATGVDKYVDLFTEEERDRLRLELAVEHPARTTSMPLQFPDGADAPLDPGPISLAYANNCAGCHGDLGQGRYDDNEDLAYPPLTNVSTRDAFVSAVRQGIDRGDEVVMPAFDTSRLTDEELELLLQRWAP